MAGANRRTSIKTGKLGPESLQISRQLNDLCYEKMLELAEVYESALSSHLKYEDAFHVVMDHLDVPKKAKEEMLRRVINISNLNQLPFHKLSPFNQFHMVSGPYIWYCLEYSPPRGFTPEMVRDLLNSFEFAEFTDQLSKEVSQQVKGALWNPRVKSKNRSRKSKKSARLISIFIWIILLGLIVLAGFLSN